MLTSLRGDRWRRVRAVLTPTFSGSKLKTMTPIIADAVNDMIGFVDKKADTGDEFDIYGMFQALINDVIGRTAFGIQSNVQNEENSKFFKACKDMFNVKINSWVLLAIQCFPRLDPLLYPFRRLAAKCKIVNCHYVSRVSKAMAVPAAPVVADAVQEFRQLCADIMARLETCGAIATKKRMISDKLLECETIVNTNANRLDKQKLDLLSKMLNN
ncbi:unnamed protein product, partial [Medioppia subpectinata]